VVGVGIIKGKNSKNKGKTKAPKGVGVGIIKHKNSTNKGKIKALKELVLNYCVKRKINSRMKKEKKYIA